MTWPRRDERVDCGVVADHRAKPLDRIFARVRAGQEVVAHVGQRALAEDAEEHEGDVRATGPHEGEDAPVEDGT